jgi:serine/threonine protein kinase
MNGSSGDDDRTVVGTGQPTGPDDAPTVVSRGAAGTPAPRSDDDGHALPLGTRLGEFELTAKIGEGGFSIVYLAWDHSLERKVALKEYMPTSIAARAGGTRVNPRSERHRDTFEAGLRSFINEAKLLAQFDHRSLVKVYRFWEAHGTAYMVMPLYEGKTLRDTVRAMPAPPDESWLRALLGPLTEALQVIHAEHCYHRDIAPDNVMLLAPTGAPLLLDFGAARRVIGDMTQALTIILKPGYAPIEQYAEVPGMRQGAWTDVYALAAVVYWAITGKIPPPSVGRAVRDSHVPLAECAAGRYSLSFLQAIDRALIVLPDARTPSIDVLRAELGLGDEGANEEPRHAASRSIDPEATVIHALRDAEVARAAPDRPITGKSARLAWLGATIAMVAAAGGLWFAFRAPAPPAPNPAPPAATPEASAPAPTPPPVIAPTPPPQAASPPSAVPAPLALPTPPVAREAAPAAAPAERKAPRAAVASSEPRATERRSANAERDAECARVLQRLSLGETSPALIERGRALKCR